MAATGKTIHIVMEKQEAGRLSRNRNTDALARLKLLIKIYLL